MWYRYRFFEAADCDDWRPVTFPPPGPCWCTGYRGDGAPVIVAYLRPHHDVTDWWPGAHDVSREECSEITFTSRFPQPDWWHGEARP